MRTELYKITTGSLLHDVGKVVHRTGDSHSHAESGYAFLKEQTGLDDAEILQQVSACVCPGGYLLYSTCTFSPEENEAVVEAFLRSRKDFYLEKLTLPSVFPENTTGMLTLIPGQYDTDGFFICRMRRKA